MTCPIPCFHFRSVHPEISSLGFRNFLCEVGRRWRGFGLKPSLPCPKLHKLEASTLGPASVVTQGLGGFVKREESNLLVSFFPPWPLQFWGSVPQLLHYPGQRPPFQNVAQQPFSVHRILLPKRAQLGGGLFSFYFP